MPSAPRRPPDAPLSPSIVPRPGELSAAAVPSRRGVAVHQCPHGRGYCASPDRGQRLPGPDLFPPGHALGLPGTGPQRRPLLPRRRRTVDRPPPGAGATALLRRDRRLLPGAATPAGVVLRRRGLFRRPRPGRSGRPALAVAGAAG